MKMPQPGSGNSTSPRAAETWIKTIQKKVQPSPGCQRTQLQVHGGGANSAAATTGFDASPISDGAARSPGPLSRMPRIQRLSVAWVDRVMGASDNPAPGANAQPNPGTSPGTAPFTILAS